MVDRCNWIFKLETGEAGRRRVRLALHVTGMLAAELNRALARQGRKIKVLASFNNHEEACNMLCGKGRVRTQDLGYQSGVL